jgi:hypothetical protein
MNPVALLGLAGVGLLLTASKSTANGTIPVPLPVPGSGPPAPAPSRPVATPVLPPPPITVTPNGRHLSEREKTVLRLWIPREDLEQTILWWDRPASTFADETGATTVLALTTPQGIYLRGKNHEIVRSDELATLGHELVHAGQFRRGENRTKTSAELELPAYQTGLGIRGYLDQQAGLGAEWGQSYAGNA